MAVIFDNIETKFVEGLQGIISNPGVKRVDFCVGYFNLRGWNQIEDYIDQLPGDFVYENDNRVSRVCRLLIGMHRPTEELLSQLYGHSDFLADSEYALQCKLQIASEFKKQLLIGTPSTDAENTLRHLSKQLKEGKLTVKLYVREPLHAKLYLAYRPEDNSNKIPAIVGSSNLTFGGLTTNGELNAEIGDSDNAQKLANWFDDRWNDNFSIDITKELAKIIDNSWAGRNDIPPYYIYLKTAYHLSQEARNGIKEFTLPLEFRRELFEFQENAVKIAAKHLASETRGGAMIGDVVGLGKTITACAIAKMWEMTYGSTTLIICPANLQTMWHKYIKKYDMKADVMSIAKDFNVDESRYYRLIIIDESHNLRNSDGTRYHRIKELIQKQNSKVLLLTATPYNKDFSDLASQLRLFLNEDLDLGIRPENYISDCGGERGFMQKHSETPIRSIAAFEKSQNTEDWSELMKLFLVRRTRTFIKNNYAKTDPSNHRKYLQFNDGSKSYFPDRLPHSVKFPTKKGDQFSHLYSQEMIDLMGSLNLPRYGLSLYVNPASTVGASNAEKQIIENLSRAGNRMMGFCKSTFFKRMDSSGYSFLMTLYRHLIRNFMYIYAIDEKLPFPIDDENSIPNENIDNHDSMLFTKEDESLVKSLKVPTEEDHYLKKAKEYYTLVSNKNNVQWLSSTYFKRTLKQQLKADCNTLFKMINKCGIWNPQEDMKLFELHKLLTKTHPNEKVVVFTQYSDTADYISYYLKKMGITSIEKATGNSEDPTALVERFSPRSNEVDISKVNEIRVLIATDVLSEGQNLQDSHIIVNFDLPWAIIRLIQRAGRVDRIGQECDHIDCYSFFPAEGVEDIIKLKKRLNDRINENAEIVGSDELFFDGNEQNLKDMYNEKSGVLDDDDDTDVDLGSMAFQIWKNATDADPNLKAIIPNLSNWVTSTKAASNELSEGVITYAKTYSDYDVLVWLDKDGKEITRAQKRILQALACDKNEPIQELLPYHYNLVTKTVETVSKESTTTIGGILGNRFSTRFRIIQLLEKYAMRPLDLFFDADKQQRLKLVINDIYNYPLLEQSKFMLGRMLRTASEDDIVESVLEMRESGNLCRIDEDKIKSKEPSIICSMGIRKI